MPVTPAGSPETEALFPLPPIAYLIGARAVLIQIVWLSLPAPELSAIVASGVTVILPVLEGVTQGPVVDTV